MTSSLQHLPRRDVERLSAYLDGELSPPQERRLEARMGEEPVLRDSLAELRRTVGLLRAVPQVEPPHNFILTPEMVGQRTGPRGYPVLQMATAVAALAFIVVLGFDAATFASAPENLAPSSFRAEEPMLPVQAESELGPTADEGPIIEQEAEAPAEQEQDLAVEVTGEEAEPEFAAGAADQVEEEERAMAPQGSEAPALELEGGEPAGEAAATATASPAPTRPAATATASPSATFEPTEALAPLEAAEPAAGQPIGRSIGPSRDLLRITELALAALVIVLAFVTYRLRPRRS